MKPIKGFPSTSQDDYQLNVINIARHGVRNFSRQEIACQGPQGMFRYTYQDAFRRMNQFAGALKALGVSIWDLRRKQGYVVTGLDVKLLGPDDAKVPHDGKSPGEICVCGPWITGCYHRTPMSDQQFTADGFWRSGDVATMDEEGYLKITDRVKDVIKSGGEWISSVDMENELMSYHPVLEAAVVGIRHPKWEERPLALVILREEHRGKLGKEALFSHLAHKFAKWQIPDEILFVDEIPKTSVGKFNKKMIRETHQHYYMV